MQSLKRYFNELMVNLSKDKEIEEGDFLNLVFPIARYIINLYVILAFTISPYQLFVRGMESTFEVFLCITCLSESFFYLYCIYIYKNALPIKSVGPLSPKRREELINLLVHKGLLNQQHINNWFLPLSDQLISRMQASDFLSSLLFGKRHKELEIKEIDEVEIFVKKIEAQAGNEFPTNSFSSEREPALAPFYSFSYQYKPLVFYLAVVIIQKLASLILMANGFRLNHLSSASYTYWVLKPTENNKEDPPIFFVHGVGIGVSQYLGLLLDMKSLYPNRCIIALNVPYICLVPTLTVDSLSVTLEALDEIFQIQKINQVSFVGHSYGTYIGSWLITHRPHYFAKILLIDAACFCNYNPKLVSDIFYHNTTTFVGKLICFLVFDDLFIATTFRRNTYWHDFELMVEYIKCPTKVILSKYDFIINTKAVSEYLDDIINEHSDLQLKVVVYDDLAHGSFMLSPSHTATILEGI